MVGDGGQIWTFKCIKRILGLRFNFLIIHSDVILEEIFTHRVLSSLYFYSIDKNTINWPC